MMLFLIRVETCDICKADAYVFRNKTKAKHNTTCMMNYYEWLLIEGLSWYLDYPKTFVETFVTKNEKFSGKESNRFVWAFIILLICLLCHKYRP